MRIFTIILFSIFFIAAGVLTLYYVKWKNERSLLFNQEWVLSRIALSVEKKNPKLLHILFRKNFFSSEYQNLILDSQDKNFNRFYLMKETKDFKASFKEPIQKGDQILYCGELTFLVTEVPRRFPLAVIFLEGTFKSLALGSEQVGPPCE